MTGLLNDKIALITGASRGIGRAVALRYAAEGAHVIALARTVGALEELDDEIKSLGATATLVPLDLRDFDAIDRMGAAIYERWGRLDILVGNAGSLGVLTPLAHLTPQVFAEALEVNVTANWRLIRSMDPLLRVAEAGRAIFVTSGLARKIRAYWGAYALTKAALEAMVKTYADELEITRAKANLISPGPTRTRMRATAMPGEDPQTVKPPEVLTDLFLELARPECELNGQIVNFETAPVA